MPNKLKWTSKAAKPFVEQMHQVILSKEWGDIFSSSFEPSDIDFAAFHQSNDDWESKFSLKQVRENLTNWIEKQRAEKGRAEDEEIELTGRMAGVNLNSSINEGMDDDDDSDNPKMVKFPTWIMYYKDIRSSDEYATILSLIPQGEYYARIDGSQVRYEVVVDPTLYDPDMLLQLIPAFNSLEWGSFIEAFATQGRLYIEDQLDYQYPERIRIYCVHDIKFDIEQNFVSRGNIPAWFDWTSPKGNRFLMTTVVKTRDNTHRQNAGARHAFQATQPVQLPPNMFNNSTTNGMPHNPTMGMHQRTPQQSNVGGTMNHQSPFPFPTQYQSPMTHQQSSAPATTMQNNQGFHQQSQNPMGPSSPPFHSKMPMGFYQHTYASPPFHGQQQQFSTYHIAQPSAPELGRGQAYNGHFPTPGVPAAAGRHRATSSSEYTEVTVEPAPPPNNQHLKSPPNYNQNSHPVVETVHEAPLPKESPKKVPVKKSYITQAFDYVRGGNQGENSSDESHMNQPKKYHAQSHHIEEDSTSSTF